MSKTTMPDMSTFQYLSPDQQTHLKQCTVEFADEELWDLFEIAKITETFTLLPNTSTDTNSSTTVPPLVYKEVPTFNQLVEYSQIYDKPQTETGDFIVFKRINRHIYTTTRFANAYAHKCEKIAIANRAFGTTASMAYTYFWYGRLLCTTVVDLTSYAILTGNEEIVKSMKVISADDECDREGCLIRVDGIDELSHLEEAGESDQVAVVIDDTDGTYYTTLHGALCLF